MAGRTGARVRTRPVDHTPLVTAPDDVVDIILDAVGDVATGWPASRTDQQPDGRRGQWQASSCPS
jgi:hypothetical protein